MKESHLITEAEILEEIIVPDRGDLKPEAADAILELRLSAAATKRVRALLRKNNRGSLSSPERMELEKYLRVGQLLDLLQAKARLALTKKEAA